MADSLVFGGVELLGGGLPSTLPGIEGAIIRLGRDYSLGAPAWTSDKVSGLLLAGEQLTPIRASNRTAVLPVVMIVPPTGDKVADRTTLAAARELVLQTATQEGVRLTWTREGGLPLVLDVQGVTTTTIEYSVIREQNLCALVEIELEAFPFGHSDSEESVLLTSTSTLWDQPPAPVVLDNFTTAVNFLAGDLDRPDNSTFETSLGTWVPAVNAALSRSSAQAHAGTWSMLMTSVAAGNMTARHLAPTDVTIPAYAMWVDPGDTVTARGWARAVTTGRTCSIGVEFYTPQGVQVGSRLAGANITDSTSAWTQATASVTAPDGANWAVAVPLVAATGGAGEGHYWDDVWLDAGPVYSLNDPGQWSLSPQTAVLGGVSARWSRVSRQAPVYSHRLPAAVDITGRTKLQFYAGLATSQASFPTWHKGEVYFFCVLYDAAGRWVSSYTRRYCRASGIPGVPHWQMITAAIPQVGTGFDYTQIVGYAIWAYNTWEFVKPVGHPVLQAGFYLNPVSAVATSTGSPGLRGLFSTLPGIVGSAPCPIGIQAAPGPSATPTIVEWTTAGTKSITTPAGLTKWDKAEAWAAGGGGACGDADQPQWYGGGGAGGGEYAMELNMPVLGSTLYNPVVGAGGLFGNALGPGNTATDGGDSTIPGSGTGLVRAHGGKRGWRSRTKGGSKGGSGSINYLHFNGGDGHQANTVVETGYNGRVHGGASGSSGGTGHDGKDADSYVAPGAVAGGGPGAEGGHLFDNNHGGQTPDTGPGGGGSGGAVASSDNTTTGPAFAYSGATGRDGKVKLAYGAGVTTPLLSFLAHMPNPDAPAALSPVIPVGNGADSPSGSIEYPVPDVGGLKARFDGTYSIFLIGSGTYGASGSSRTLTVVFKQYQYSGGPTSTFTISRDVTPSTDVTNGWIELGTLTLPLQALPAGQTDAYYTVTVQSGQSADRYLDVLALDTQGQTMLFNKATPGYNSLWFDAPDRDHDLGSVLGSDADRNRAQSITQYLARYSGGPMQARPGAHNRLLVYSAQGCPGATLVYVPHWLADRLQ